MKPCSRVGTSFTGRPSLRAATATSAVRCVRPPFDPKAPPTNGLTTRIWLASMPSWAARPFLMPYTFWLGSWTVSCVPFQEHWVAKSSIGLWCWAGVE